MRRREFLASLAAGAGAACSPVAARLGTSQDAIARGAAYLRSRQSQDGAWRSRTYGLLREGDSLTGLALHALLSARADSSHVIDAGLTFLRSRMRDDGALGMSDPAVPDYPNYATSFALRALCKVKPNGWQGDAQRIIAWLRTQQFSEANGWKPTDAAYGAWGMGGEPHTPPHAGHVDLSMTCHVIEALVEARIPLDDPALVRVRTFVDRCRNASDGGFCFSTVVEEANKAGKEHGRYRSYGTATADGLRALIALGSDPRQIAGAQDWLARHHRTAEVPGFDRHPDQRWRQGLFYYYAAALPSAQRQSLAGDLIARQLPDGSWSNPEPLVKEDDPLIATPLTLLALSPEPRA